MTLCPKTALCPLPVSQHPQVRCRTVYQSLVQLKNKLSLPLDARRAAKTVHRPSYAKRLLRTEGGPPMSTMAETTAEKETPMVSVTVEFS